MRGVSVRLATVIWMAAWLPACVDGGTGVTATPDPLILPPPAARDTVSVPRWARSGVTFPYNLDQVAIRTSATFLTVAASTISTSGLNPVTALDPANGAAFWSASLTSPADFAGVDGVFRVTHGSIGDRRESLLDGSSGAAFLTQPLSTTAPTGGLVGASVNTVLGRLGDTLLVGRNRATGAIRWRARVSLGDCGFIDVSPCSAYAGQGGGAFHFIHVKGFAPPVFELVRVSEAGIVTTTEFVDPSAAAMGFAFFAPPTVVDSAGAIAIVVTNTGVIGLDAKTGAIRWSAVHLRISNGLLLDKPVVQFLRGSTPLVHLVFPFSSPGAPAYSREIIRDALTGRIVRQVLRLAAGLDAVTTRPCGETGMVLMRKTGRFIYTDSRTGSETAGQIIDQTTNLPAEAPVLSTWSNTFASGHIVYATGSAPDGLWGFRCRP